MFVECDKCNGLYDDEHRWTICPHNLLVAGPTTPRYNCGNPGYCAGHDLFGCTFSPPEAMNAKTQAVDEAAGSDPSA